MPFDAAARPDLAPQTALSAYVCTGPFSPQARNELADRIAAEIIDLTGCTAKVAAIAGGAYANFPNAPDHGLSGYAEEWSSSLARIALKAWKASKTPVAA